MKQTTLAGRPLLIGGEAASAALGGSAHGWPSAASLEVEAIEPGLRRRLGELWARDALFEHASVASFARFSLHLLAVAAPPELLDASHRAAIDEVKHARLCFALASAYAGEPLGPGPLPLDGDLLGPLDLPSIAAAAVREGCVGETLASLEAATAGEEVTVAAVEQVLTVITEDEARHAELAWRFVKWALEEGDTLTRRAIEQAFRESIFARTAARAPASPLDALILPHGRLSERRKQQLFAEGIAEVVRPAAEALLGTRF